MAQMEKIKFLSEIEAPALSIDGQEVATKQEVENIVGDVSIVKPGTGEYSIQTESSNAIGDYSTALGLNTVAGMKAYYYTGINPTTKKIYLSEISEITSWEDRKDNPPIYGDTVTDENYLISGFTAPAWTVGDWLGVMNESHYIYQIQVKAVHDNVIEYDGELGFNKIPRDTTTETVDITSDVSCIANSQFYTVSGNTYKNATIKFNYMGTCLHNLEGMEPFWGELSGDAEITGDLSPIGGNPLSIDFEIITGLESENFGINRVTITEATYPTLVPAWDTGSDSYTVFNLDTPTEGGFSLKESATAMGSECKAVGSYSYATGYRNIAYQFGHAEGRENIAGYGSHAEGKLTRAIGDEGCHTEGRSTEVRGGRGHAEGSFTQAFGHSAHAEGRSYFETEDYQIPYSPSLTAADCLQIWESRDGNNKPLMAFGMASHAEGCGTLAVGTYAHTEGDKTVAQGWGAHAEGGGTYATGNSSHAEGWMSKSLGSQSHAEGNNTQAVLQSSHAEGEFTLANGLASHAEGCETKASYQFAHAEGYKTTASSQAAHAEGYNTTASGWISHAEGNSTTASGTNSHAEGQNCQATTDNTHAGGANSVASAVSAFAHGTGVIANKHSQTVIGRYNDDSVNTIFTVGAGETAESRKNLIEAYKDTMSVNLGLSLKSSWLQTVVGGFNQATQDTNGFYRFIVGGGGSDTARKNAMTVSRDGEVALCSGGSLKIGNATLTEEKLNNLSTGGGSTSYNIKTVNTYIEIPSGTSLAYMERIPPTTIVIDNERALLKFGPEYTESQIGTIDDVVQKINNTNWNYSVILNPLQTTYTTVIESSGSGEKTSYADRIIYTIEFKDNAASLTLDATTNKYVGTVTMHYLQEA